MISMNFQKGQMAMHLFLAWLAYLVTPSEYFIQPEIPTPWNDGIQLLYATSFMYHVYLWSHDPVALKMPLMTIHHAVTLALIAASWYYNYESYGAVIMFINDITDVPMFALRIARKEGRSLAWQTPICDNCVGWLDVLAYLLHGLYYWNCMCVSRMGVCVGIKCTLDHERVLDRFGVFEINQDFIRISNGFET